MSGEDTLLVAVDTEDPFSRLEVGKIPYQFALNEIIRIEYFEIPHEIFVLILLRTHDAWKLVLSRQGIGTEFREDKRHIEVFGFPAFHLVVELVDRIRDIRTAADIPAIVAVETQEITKHIALAFSGALFFSNAPVIGRC